MPKKLMRSISHARAGAEHALKTQRNIWIHIFAGLFVVSIALWLRVSPIEMALLAVAIAFVLTAEMLNTAIEEVVNLAKPETHPQAALAKNVAAGAVLTAAIGAAAVGLIIFLPRLMGWN